MLQIAFVIGLTKCFILQHLATTDRTPSTLQD